jgi:antibiotic biosynthesis monooxygenase (ABM) superfamily enzyme
MNDDNDKNIMEHSNPVTIIVKRIAKKNKISEFEEWLSAISKEFSRQDGGMGIDITRPASSNKTKSEYVMIFGFNSYYNLAEAHYDTHKLTGLELWFTPHLKDDSSPRVHLNPSPRYKMVIVTIPVISILL